MGLLIYPSRRTHKALMGNTSSMAGIIFSTLVSRLMPEIRKPVEISIMPPTAEKSASILGVITGTINRESVNRTKYIAI